MFRLCLWIKKKCCSLSHVGYYYFTSLISKEGACFWLCWPSDLSMFLCTLLWSLPGFQSFGQCWLFNYIFCWVCNLCMCVCMDCSHSVCYRCTSKDLWLFLFHLSFSSTNSANANTTLGLYNTYFVKNPPVILQSTIKYIFPVFPLNLVIDL